MFWGNREILLLYVCSFNSEQSDDDCLNGVFHKIVLILKECSSFTYIDHKIVSVLVLLIYSHENRLVNYYHRLRR